MKFQRMILPTLCGISILGFSAAAHAEDNSSVNTANRFDHSSDHSSGYLSRSSGPLYSKRVHVSGVEEMKGVPFRVGNGASGVRCAAPCDLRLTFREGEYGELVFETPQRTFSETFRLKTSSPDFDVQVIHAGSFRRLAGGIGLVAGGIPTLAIGAFGWFAFIIGPPECDCDLSDPKKKLEHIRSDRRYRNTTVSIGTVGTALGLAAIIVGSWWIHTGRSRIRVIPKETDAGSVQSSANVSFGIVPVQGGASAVASGEF
jgi:hypothetical protein